jgi:virginiamycin A acetyltransferase
MHGPDPTTLHPVPGHPRVCFLRNAVDRPNIEIGEFTYYDDPVEPERFADKCIRYHFDFLGDRLVIGRFCALGTGVQFVMNGANHAMTGFSTYPFNIFGAGWEKGFDMRTIEAGFRGDTIVGNDVWIGAEAMVLPGARIGDGAVVGARAVVGGTVPPYAVVVGNPARTVRRRFDGATVERLLAVAWWDWDAARITRHLDAIRGADIERLERAA